MANADLSTVEHVQGERLRAQKPPRLRKAIWVVKKYPQLMIGTLVVLLFVVVGVGASAIAPFPYDQQSLADRLAAPVWAGGDMTHPLGTDELGRDMLSRLIFGTQISLIVGLFSVVLAGLIGSTAGMISAYVGGNVDALIMRVADIQLAFPYILIAIVISAIWGAGFVVVIISLTLAGWMHFARTVRALVLGRKDSEYVVAARAIGATSPRIMLRHLLPNIVGSLLVFTTFQIPARVIAEATLSFLGLGIQPPTPSWGNMLSDNRGFLTSEPWLVILPGICISLVALGANLFGDGLRDFLDPRTRNN